MSADLIARLEAATESSRELDALIWSLFDPAGIALVEQYGSAENAVGIKYGSHGFNDREPIWTLSTYRGPAYTSSIDAALTLAGPDGKSELVIRDDHPFAILNSAIMDCPLGDFAALPRFICIAALKARLPLETEVT